MRWRSGLVLVGGLLVGGGLVVACDGSGVSSANSVDDQDAEAGVVGSQQGNPTGNGNTPNGNNGNGDAGGGDATASDAAGKCGVGTPRKSVVLNVTGRITFRGQPHSGFARLRERQSGEFAAEASVNDAGYFLLAVRSIYDPAQCGDYWIEITGGDGPPIFGERNASDLILDAWGAGPGAKQNVDISSTPIPVESTQ